MITKGQRDSFDRAYATLPTSVHLQACRYLRTQDSEYRGGVIKFGILSGTTGYIMVCRISYMCRLPRLTAYLLAGLQNQYAEKESLGKRYTLLDSILHPSTQEGIRLHLESKVDSLALEFGPGRSTSTSISSPFQFFF